MPSGSIEIAQTTRYSKWTGKNELCILAMRPMKKDFIIQELKGSMADLTDEEDRELKRTGPRNDGGPRRDFSVIHSKQLKKNHLFLGPARFVNVSRTYFLCFTLLAKRVNYSMIVTITVNCSEMADT